MLIAKTQGGITRFEVCNYTAQYRVIRVLFEGKEEFETCLNSMWETLEKWEVLEIFEDRNAAEEYLNSLKGSK